MMAMAMVKNVARQLEEIDRVRSGWPPLAFGFHTAGTTHDGGFGDKMIIRIERMDG